MLGRFSLRTMLAAGAVLTALVPARREAIDPGLHVARSARWILGPGEPAAAPEGR